jgi:hypothetical protein
MLLYCRIDVVWRRLLFVGLPNFDCFATDVVRGAGACHRCFGFWTLLLLLLSRNVASVCPSFLGDFRPQFSFRVWLSVQRILPEFLRDVGAHLVVDCVVLLVVGRAIGHFLQICVKKNSDAGGVRDDAVVFAAQILTHFLPVRPLSACHHARAIVSH